MPKTAQLLKQDLSETKQKNSFVMLTKTVADFMQLLNVKTDEIDNPKWAIFYNRYFSDLGCEIYQCLEEGFSRDAILKVIEPVRHVLKKAPFVRRIFDWPRGYAGDFETIEDLYHHRNKAQPHTREYIIEQHALNSPIVQQHRYKIKHQANMIKSVVEKNPNSPRIGILGCGGCEDIRLIRQDIAKFSPIIFLNDMDSDALKRAQENCDGIENINLIEANCLRALRQMDKEGKFDLVLAGGLLDYFDLDRTTKIISLAMKIIKPGGQFFFTNIAKNHPHKVFMEYLSNWFLLEKSEEEIINICIAAGAKADNIKITREETGITHLVTITKD